MCDVTHDVRQRSHDARANPEIFSRRPFKPGRSHQKAEHQPNCDNRKCNDDEAGEKRVEHESSSIHHRDTKIE
jgi:hypothetical protein